MSRYSQTAQTIKLRKYIEYAIPLNNNNNKLKKYHDLFGSGDWSRTSDLTGMNRALSPS